MHHERTRAQHKNHQQNNDSQAPKQMGELKYMDELHYMAELNCVGGCRCESGGHESDYEALRLEIKEELDNLEARPRCL